MKNILLACDKCNKKFAHEQILIDEKGTKTCLCCSGSSNDHWRKKVGAYCEFIDARLPIIFSRMTAEQKKEFKKWSYIQKAKVIDMLIEKGELK